MNTDPVYLSLGIREVLYIEAEGTLTPLFSGHQCCPPGHRYQGIREYYLLCFVKSGCGTFCLHDSQDYNVFTEYPMTQGDVFLIRPGQLTRYISDTDLPWTYAWIAFTGESAAGCLDRAGFAASPVIRTGADLYDRIVRLTEENILIPQSPLRWMYASAFLWKMFADLAREASPSVPIPAARQYVLTAIRLIEHRYDQALTVSGLADALGISREYFYTVFKDETGKSPLRYLLEYRVNQACRMLKESSLPIYLIAQHSGFQDQAYFSRKFHQIIGMSPSEFRRNSLQTVPPDP